MKKYRVYLWASVDVRASNETRAHRAALKLLEDDNAIMSFMQDLQVEEDGIEEITDTP